MPTIKATFILEVAKSLAASLLDLEVTVVEADLEKPPRDASDRSRRKYVLELHHTLEEVFKNTGILDESPSMEYAKALPDFVAQCEAALAEGIELQYENLPSARDLYLLLSKDALVLEKQTTGEWPPPMSQKDLKDFVTDCVGNLIFTHTQLPDTSLLMQVFMVVGLGGMDDRALFELENVGVIYEYLSKAGPMAINGYPMFLSARFMNKSDWARCLVAIKKHIEATTNLEV